MTITYSVHLLMIVFISCSFKIHDIDIKLFKIGTNDMNY